MPHMGRTWTMWRARSSEDFGTPRWNFQFTFFFTRKSLGRVKLSAGRAPTGSGSILLYKYRIWRAHALTCHA